MRRTGLIFVLVALSFVALHGQNPQGAPAPLLRAWPVKPTDGTHVMPTGDDALRAIHVVQDSGAAASQGTAGTLANAWPVKVTDGANVQPAGDSAARSINVKVTDGANVQPAGDVAARAMFVKVTDGTNTQPTGDTAARKLFVQVTDGTNSLPTGDAAARSINVKLTDGTNTVPAFLSAYIASAAGSAVTVKSGAGMLYGFSLLNNNAAVVWVEFFNTTSPTLGTTAPVAAFPIPASGTLTVPPGMVGLISNATAIGMAAVTTYNGSTTGSVSGSVFYK